MAGKNEGRLSYADLLRVVACVAVIILHCTGGWVSASVPGSADFNALNVFRGLVSWCVPMFVMLSGMFLLDPKKHFSLGTLFFRYILRIVTALLFWGVLYAIYDHWPSAGGLSFAWLRDTLRSLLLGNSHYHLWYLFMIIGLYLVTPLLRAFVRGASRADYHWLFALFFTITLLLPTLLRLRPSQTVSMYLDRLNLYMLVGYAGFYVAGYYLKAFSLGRVAECVIYLLGILGGVVSVWGTAVLSARDGQLNILLYGYLTPNVAAMAVAVFVLCRYVLGVSDERGRRRHLSVVANVTFGIYLVHDFFLILLDKLGLIRPAVSPALAVPLQTAAIFLCSFVVAWCIAKLPFVGKYLA